jgi:hypothetical protein
MGHSLLRELRMASDQAAMSDSARRVAGHSRTVRKAAGRTAREAAQRIESTRGPPRRLHRRREAPPPMPSGPAACPLQRVRVEARTGDSPGGTTSRLGGGRRPALTALWPPAFPAR